jgi:hypothetical protein
MSVRAHGLAELLSRAEAARARERWVPVGGVRQWLWLGWQGGSGWGGSAGDGGCNETRMGRFGAVLAEIWAF